MRLKFYLFLLTSFLSLNGIAQIDSKDVLFTVEEKPVFASEFIRVYNKNLNLVKDESQKDIDNYLELFVDYKLKLKEAKKLGLNKKPNYVRELANYRKQLTKNYLTDTEVTDDLVREAYDRVVYEVHAAHVLVRVMENVPAEDTLKAYNDIAKIRGRVLNEGFDVIKKDIHNGKTIFAEDLGYFSGFKMVYDFESVAYNTEVGELSKPFRTRFGYHIIKVFDKRKSKGEVEVAHIMIANNQKAKDSTRQNPAERISDIYAKLQQGEDFESLAKQFSEDKSSSSKGGKLSPFSGGQLSSKQFEEAAFALTTKGEISKPIESDFGWHIIKLYNKKPIQSFEKMRGQLEMKVKRDSRSNLINDAFVNRIKQHYNIYENNEALSYFNKIINDSYYKRSWSIPDSINKDEVIITIGDKKITYGEFADYLFKSQRKNRIQKPLQEIVKHNYTEFINKTVLSYYENNLENFNEEFAHIVSEYRDGLLLFDLMESQIWNAAKTDTLGLKEFYENNKENYFLKQRIETIVASSSKEKTAKKVKKYLEDGMNEEQITNALNKKGKINVIFTSGIMDEDHQALPANFEFKKGISKIYHHNNAFIVSNVKSVFPLEHLSFEKAKGRVTTDFQDKKEKLWMQNLHNTYKVVIDKNVLNKIKAQIKAN